MQQSTNRALAAHVSPQEVLKIYVASAGLIFLALERINKQLFGITNAADYVFTELNLYEVLSQNITQLQEATRAQMIMKTYEAANQAITIAIGKMPLMEPFDASKTATNLIAQLEALTDNKRSELNVNNFIWENVIPSEAREAIEFLKSQKDQQPDVYDTDNFKEVLDADT